MPTGPGAGKQRGGRPAPGKPAMASGEQKGGWLAGYSSAPAGLSDSRYFGPYPWGSTRRRPYPCSVPAGRPAREVNACCGGACRRAPAKEREMQHHGPTPDEPAGTICCEPKHRLGSGISPSVLAKTVTTTRTHVRAGGARATRVLSARSEPEEQPAEESAGGTADPFLGPVAEPGGRVDRRARLADEGARRPAAGEAVDLRHGARARVASDRDGRPSDARRP